MSVRRRKSDVEKQEPLWLRIPHDILYPAIGFFLGLGSPLGAFIMRYWLAEPTLPSLWTRRELQYHAPFYIYMGVGTVAVFMIFGFVLGRQSEAQRVHNRTLSARIDELQ